jgi:hypothetical protein
VAQQPADRLSVERGGHAPHQFGIRDDDACGSTLASGPVNVFTTSSSCAVDRQNT